jgi:hypothetical protein
MVNHVKALVQYNTTYNVLQQTITTSTNNADGDLIIEDGNDICRCSTSLGISY